MRFFGPKFPFVLAGAILFCTLIGGCPQAANQTPISETLLTFAEDLFRQILAAFIL